MSNNKMSSIDPNVDGADCADCTDGDNAAWVKEDYDKHYLECLPVVKAFEQSENLASPYSAVDASTPNDWFPLGVFYVTKVPCLCCAGFVFDCTCVFDSEDILIEANADKYCQECKGKSQEELKKIAVEREELEDVDTNESEIFSDNDSKDTTNTAENDEDDDVEAALTPTFIGKIETQGSHKTDWYPESKACTCCKGFKYNCEKCVQKDKKNNCTACKPPPKFDPKLLCQGGSAIPLVKRDKCFKEGFCDCSSACKQRYSRNRKEISRWFVGCMDCSCCRGYKYACECMHEYDICCGAGYNSLASLASPGSSGKSGSSNSTVAASTTANPNTTGKALNKTAKEFVPTFNKAAKEFVPTARGGSHYSTTSTTVSESLKLTISEVLPLLGTPFCNVDGRVETQFENYIDKASKAFGIPLADGTAEERGRRVLRKLREESDMRSDVAERLGLSPLTGASFVTLVEIFAGAQLNEISCGMNPEDSETENGWATDNLIIISGQL